MKTRHEPGDQVQVHARNGWTRGTIERRRPLVTIPAGTRTYEYQVSGQFRDGQAWDGTFDAEHVRAIPPRRKRKINWWCKKHPKPCEGIGADCIHW